MNSAVTKLCPASKIAADSKVLCGWGGYALEGCVDTLLRPPQPQASQLGTVYATKRRRRNGKRLVVVQSWDVGTLNKDFRTM